MHIVSLGLLDVALGEGPFRYLGAIGPVAQALLGAGRQAERVVISHFSDRVLHLGATTYTKSPDALPACPAPGPFSNHPNYATRSSATADVSSPSQPANLSNQGFLV
jgi:hypothetical protein